MCALYHTHNNHTQTSVLVTVNIAYEWNVQMWGCDNMSAALCILFVCATMATALALDARQTSVWQSQINNIISYVFAFELSRW